MGIDALGWVKKAWDWRGGARVAVNVDGQRWIERSRDGCKGLWVVLEA